jgi:hypothetical protein
VLADEWGFSLVGGSLPSGVRPEVLRAALPLEVQQHSAAKCAASFLAPLAAMVAGYAWLVYMHSITPVWQLAACWALIGTGYMGLFQIAHECARGTFLPDAPRLQVGVSSPGVFGAIHSKCGHGSGRVCGGRRVNTPPTSSQEVLGSLLMAPSLFSLAAWRVAAFTHTQAVRVVAPMS